MLWLLEKTSIQKEFYLRKNYTVGLCQNEGETKHTLGIGNQERKVLQISVHLVLKLWSSNLA